MKKIRVIIICLLIGFSTLLNAQRKSLLGQLVADGDVEGIHILNQTASKYSVSDEKGQFEILAQANDTLTISGLKYKIKMVVITKLMQYSERFNVELEEEINQLDEVILGRILTGSLESDLEETEVDHSINFYDLGIPGYKGKPMTQNERRLHDANSGGPIYTGLGVNFHKLLNVISGRTKKLKLIVALDDKKQCLERVRSEFESVIFEDNPLSQSLRNEYFYFCDEDPKFTVICKENNDLKMVEFLAEKLKAFKKNLKPETKE